MRNDWGYIVLGCGKYLVAPNVQEMWIARKKKTILMLSLVLNYGVASFLSWSKFIYNPKMGFMRVRGYMTSITSFRMWTPWLGVDKLANTYLH